MYYFETNGKPVITENLPSNVYALAGYQDEQDKGLLCVHVPEGLTPLKDKDGKQYRIIEQAGNSFNGKNWHP